MLSIVRRILAIILIILLCLPGDASAARRKKKKRTVYPTAVSAILFNVSDNRFLFAKQIDRQVFPASTTKVMTALLAMENLALDSYVTVGERATDVQPTKLDLRPGEQYLVRDLIYAALLKSANDAAVVLAEAVAGTEWKFVQMMNSRAHALGAKRTRFANAHGLPSAAKQFTTARDMAMIYKEALKKPFFKQAIALKYRVINSKDGRRLFLKSHNKSLFLGWKKDIYGKTGYTRQAQSCFVGHVLKGNDVYIVAVFNDRKRWEDIKFIVERYGKIDL